MKHLVLFFIEYLLNLMATEHLDRVIRLIRETLETFKSSSNDPAGWKIQIINTLRASLNKGSISDFLSSLRIDKKFLHFV